MKMFVKPCVLALVATIVPAANAHFLWVDVDTSTDNKPEARFYFCEAATPGSDKLLDRLDPTVAWVLLGNNELLDLSLSAWRDEDEGTAALVAPVPASDARSIEARCCYGVFTHGKTSMLLNYYAKHLNRISPADLPNVSVAERLALDIRPAIADDRLVLEVAFHGKPAENVPLVVTDSQNVDHEIETNTQGQASLTAPVSGRYAIRATYVEPNASGEYGGKPYSQTRHISTLTMTLAAVGTGEATSDKISATELLNEARGARAVWNAFPGVRAKMTLEVDNRAASGTITIDEDGTATLEGFGDLAGTFVREQIDSMIMHRMPGSTVEDTGADYEPETGTHALGRKVRLAEERMGSVYRIKDGVITEVNRVMGPMRFTISVMRIKRNAEGKYLPGVFTVSFWDKNSGNLLSTHTYSQTWRRVGPFDFPEDLIIVSAEKNTRRVVKMHFSDYKLLGGKK